MFKMRPLKSALLVTACIFIFSKAYFVNAQEIAADGVILKYEFTPGDTLSYEITSQTQMDAVKSDFNQTTKSKSQTFRDLKIDKVLPDGSAEVLVIVRYVRMESQFDEREPQIYDSSDPKTYLKDYEHIQKTIDQPLAKLLISNSGKLKNIIAVNGAKEEEINSDPSMNFLVTFPEEPVSVGHTWKENISQELKASKTLKVNLNMLRTFKVIKIEDNIATIQFKTVILTPIRDPAQEVRAIQMEPAGEMKFDINRGAMVSRTTRSNKTVINFLGPGSSLVSNVMKTDILTDQPPPIKKVVIDPDNLGIIR
jgi:hypothetical protein